MNKALQPNRNTSHCTGKKKGTGKVYYILTLGTGTVMQVNKGEQVKVKLLIIYMQSCMLKYGKMNTNPRVMKIYIFSYCPKLILTRPFFGILYSNFSVLFGRFFNQSQVGAECCPLHLHLPL